MQDVDKKVLTSANSASASSGTRTKMYKEVTTKDDGRTLIYYTFVDAAGDDSGERKGSAGK